MLHSVKIAHELLWEKFYHHGSGLFYEYEASNPERFPTSEEIDACVPNTAGWVTGMEDCCLNGGWILDGIILAHKVTGKKEFAEKAKMIFNSLLSMGNIPSREGFIARGFSPGSPGKCYPNSSTDQYTSWFYAVLMYCRSSLATSDDKEKAGTLVANACRLIEKFNHDIPTVEMKPSIYGDSSAATPDRACRLLLFYKTASVLTGDPHWESLYHEKASEGDAFRATSRFPEQKLDKNRNLHSQFQSQATWNALYQIESDPELKSEYLYSMRICANSVVDLVTNLSEWEEGCHDTPPGWRDVWKEYIEEYPDVDFKDFKGRRVFIDLFRSRSGAFHTDLKKMRNPLDAAAICMLCPDSDIQKKAADALYPILRKLDFTKVRFGTALACLEGAYWRGVEKGFLPE